MSFNDEKEQYLLTTVLRPGNAVARAGAIGIRRRMLERVRRAFPKARLRVRLEGGFADPRLLEFLDTQGVEHGVAMAKNAVLNRLAEPKMNEARELSEGSGETEHVYEDDLILQLLHAFKHILHNWRRLCSLLDIAYFLEHRPSDVAFWDRFLARLEQSPLLCEIAGVVFLLAAGVFGATIPLIKRGSLSRLRVCLAGYMPLCGRSSFTGIASSKRIT